MNNPNTLQDRQEATKYQMASVLAPMLIAIAVFSLTVITLNDQKAIATESIFAVIGAFCLFASTLIVDSLLDNISYSPKMRITLLGGGYVCFCLLVAVLAIVLPIIYLVAVDKFSWTSDCLKFVPAGIITIVKMMFEEDYNIGVLGMITFYLLSIVMVLKAWGLVEFC